MHASQSVAAVKIQLLVSLAKKAAVSSYIRCFLELGFERMIGNTHVLQVPPCEQVFAHALRFLDGKSMEEYLRLVLPTFSFTH